MKFILSVKTICFKNLGGHQLYNYSHEYAIHRFFANTALQQSGGLWLVRSGKNKAKSHYSIGPRSIEYFSLHFILNGKGQFTYNDQNIPVKKGDLFCLFPNQVHAYRTDQQEHLQMFWLAINGNQAAALISKVGLSLNRPYL